MNSSALGLRESEFVHNPFKIRVSVSPTPPALQDVSPTSFQSQLLWRFIFLVQVLQAGDPDVGLRSLGPQWGPLWLWYSLLLSCQARGMCVLTRPHLWSPIHHNGAFSFYILSYRKYVLWVFKLFLGIVILYIVIVFCVSAGGGELKILLLHNLDLTLPGFWTSFSSVPTAMYRASFCC